MQFHLLVPVGSRDFLPLCVDVKCGSIPRHGGQLIIHCLIIVPAGPCNQRETRNKSVSADEYYITTHDIWFLPALSAILSPPTTVVLHFGSLHAPQQNIIVMKFLIFIH